MKQETCWKVEEPKRGIVSALPSSGRGMAELRREMPLSASQMDSEGGEELEVLGSRKRLCGDYGASGKADFPGGDLRCGDHRSNVSLIVRVTPWVRKRHM